MTDESIIELYFARNEAALTETDRAYGAFCRRIALNILTIIEAAEECVNDTYLKAWNSIPPTRPNSLRAFLGSITRNLSISRYRLNHAEKRGAALLLSELGDCIPEPASEGNFDERHLIQTLNEWLRALPDRDRALFVRRYFSGDDLKTLAGLCGVTQNRMAQMMFRLRKKLREKLESEGFNK